MACIAKHRRRRRPCGFESLESRLALSAEAAATAFELVECHYEYDGSPASLEDSGAATAAFALDQTILLHSNPGAAKVIYLDFDGHVTTGTRWNTSYGANIQFD